MPSTPDKLEPGTEPLIPGQPGSATPGASPEDLVLCGMDYGEDVVPTYGPEDAEVSMLVCVCVRGLPPRLLKYSTCDRPNTVVPACVRVLCLVVFVCRACVESAGARAMSSAGVNASSRKCI